MSREHRGQVDAERFIAERGDRQRRRSAAAFAGLAAATVAAVAAVAVLGTVAGSSPGPVTGPGPQHVAASYPASRLITALTQAEARHFLEKLAVRYRPERFGGQPQGTPAPVTTWNYQGQPRLVDSYTSDGQLISHHWLPSGTYAQASNHTWSIVAQLRRLTDPINGCQSGRSPWGPVNELSATPSFILATLKCGGLAVAGHPRADGQQLIKLVNTKRLKAGQVTLYVSPRTYLPVKAVTPVSTSTFRWLPPTPANLAMLKANVPAGYRRVAPWAFGSPGLDPASTDVVAWNMGPGSRGYETYGLALTSPPPAQG